MGLAALLGLVAPGTYAHWTDEATVDGTTFTSGTLDLRVDDADSTTGYTALNLSLMVPGNSVAGVLTVKNSGNVPLKYTATTTASNADGKGLGAALVVTVTGASSVTGASPAQTCAGAPLSGFGTSLGGSLTTTSRLLAAASTETLCVQVTLPTNASTAVQGALTEVGFTFTGTSDLS